MEKWKDITGFENVYQISNYGNVKSLSRLVNRSNGRKMHIKSRIIKTYYTSQGYEHAVFQNGLKMKHMTVHRLVALAFIPNPKNKEHVNHLDGIKANNHISNLEWATRSENEKHAHRIGLKDWRGENQSQAKLNNSKVLEIRYLRGKLSGRETGIMYGVAHATIFAIWHRRTWSHI